MRGNQINIFNIKQVLKSVQVSPLKLIHVWTKMFQSAQTFYDKLIFHQCLESVIKRSLPEKGSVNVPTSEVVKTFPQESWPKTEN